MDTSTSSTDVFHAFDLLQPDLASPPLQPDTSDALENASSKTLKRGAACQTCRKRKLRCSGDKPMCATCAKTRTECVYDVEMTKSKGRMKQLEEKIASLENILSRPSASETPHQPQAVFSQTLGGLFDWNGATTGAMGGPSSFASFSQYDATQPTTFNFLNPSPGAFLPVDGITTLQDSWSSQPAACPTTVVPPPSFLSDPSSHAPTSTTANSTTPTTPPDFGTNPSLASSQQPNALFFAQSSMFKIDFGLPSQWKTDLKIEPVLRDHLLALFIPRASQFHLDLDVGRFYASLAGPLDRQPSLALVFAMCAAAARFSPHSEIQKLDSSFVRFARLAIQVDLQNPLANLLQTTQASVVLSAFMYSRAAFMEGWLQTGASTRLVSCCCLAKTSTSSFAASSPETDNYQYLFGPRSLKRRPFNRLVPPQDGIEHGERILCFWRAYFMDRIASAGSGWLPGIADEDISTPFPRTLEEYARDDFGDEPEPSLTELFLPNPLPARARPDSNFASLIKATAFFHRAAHMGKSAALRNTPPSSPNGPPTPIPQALVDLERSLRNFVDALPPSARTLKVVGGVPPWNAPTAPDMSTFGIDPTVFSINTMIHASLMLLYEDMAAFDPSYRARSVHAASSGTQMIANIIDIDFAYLDLFLTMLWRHFAHLLLEEAKRLQDLGDFEAASLRQIDVEVLILSMRRAGECWGLGAKQATFIEELQGLDISPG